MGAVTEADQMLFKCPSVASQLPVVLANDVEWTGFDAHCAAYDRVIDEDCFRGRVTQPLPTVAVIEAVGYCEVCNLVSRFVHRFHDGSRITFLTRKGWCEARPRESFFARAAGVLKRVVSLRP